MNKKRIKDILIILLLVLLVGSTGYASDRKGDYKGIIKIEHENVKERKTKFLCDKIADWENGSYAIKSEYINPKIDLNQIRTAEELKQFTESIDLREKNSTIIAYSNGKGEAQFQDLEEGVYFIRSEDSTMMPSLVSIPMWDEKKQCMQYEVTIIPKYIKEQSKEIKRTVKTGDYQSGVEQVFVLLIISGSAIVMTKILLKILQKY